MAFCTNCGMKLEDGAKFCTNCGNKLEEQGTPAGRASEPFKDVLQPEETPFYGSYSAPEEPVNGEYFSPYQSTYCQYSQGGDYNEDKDAARKKKNRNIIIAICAVATVALVLIIGIVCLIVSAGRQIIAENNIGEIYESEAPDDDNYFVSSTTELKENTFWYGFAEISNHSGEENYSEGIYEVWGIIAADDSGRTFFELYDNYDLEGGPILSYWIELYPEYAGADIGDEDAWLLNIYLVEDDEPYFSFWLDNGAIEVWFPYEFEGESFDFSFFLREEGAEWDEENDPYLP